MLPILAMAASAPDSSASRKLPTGLRWTDIIVRGIHLVAVVVLGGATLGAPVDGARAAIVVFMSGVVMLSFDTWQRPGHLRELAGATMLLKIGLVGWMALDEGVRMVLFWLIVGVSGIVSHAPASFRHIQLLGNPSRNRG
jgi:hypothetical protein